MKQTILQPHLCGTDIPHTPEFRIDRPCDPHRSCLIFSFRSPGIILTVNGTERAAPGDCIIHSVDFPQYHTGIPGEKEGYRNDFLHVSPDAVLPVMKRLALPWNQRIPTARPEILTPFIRELQLELLNPDLYTQEILLNLIERMLLTIARSHRILEQNIPRTTPAERRHLPEFHLLRESILRSFQRNFTLDGMAKELCLSPERFAALYKRFFGITPYQEMIRARIAHAKRLLATTELEIKEIAAQSGWDDVHYFSRIFHKKTGISPTTFRIQNR